MGIFNFTIAVGNVNGDSFEEVEAAVDTACDYTTVPGRCCSGWAFR